MHNNNRMISLAESKQVSLNILKYVDSFCRNNDISYFAAYGTLLGAVRHQGFIPWDDDIDLFMFRHEYERFISMFMLHEHEKYRCISFENNTFYFPYSKIHDITTRIVHDDVINEGNMGIGIDIFPLDYLSDEKKDIPNIAKRLNLPKKMLRYSVYNNLNEVLKDGFSITKGLFFYIAKAFGNKNLVKICKSKIKKYTHNKTKYYCGYVGSFIQNYISEIPTEYFSETVYLNFEDMKLPVPFEYKKILKKLYGDYMELPPEEKRIPHASQAFWL